MYQKDILREYINNSELRIFSDKIRIRLSSDLACKYDEGVYNNYLKNMQKSFEMIEELNIKYPGGANPILYVYIVPDDNYSELLHIPKIFDRGTGGGRPVPCYDLDGFNSAYGLSQNLLENRPEIETRISRIENEVHELSHIVNSQFFTKNKTIHEGFAETLPLYALDFEDSFDEHRNIICELDENRIMSAKELLDSEKDGTYGAEAVSENKSCSFRLSYISSYLLVRGCVEKIEENNNCSKAEAIQHFLEIVKQSNCTNEYLIYDIANAIGIPQDVLLYKKDIQMKVIQSLSNSIIK